VTEGMDFIHLAQNWNQWRTLVNTVVTLISKKAGISLSAGRIFTSQEENFKELVELKK
jgi:hypothetical protein